MKDMFLRIKEKISEKVQEIQNDVSIIKALTIEKNGGK